MERGEPAESRGDTLAYALRYAMAGRIDRANELIGQLEDTIPPWLGIQMAAFEGRSADAVNWALTWQENNPGCSLCGIFETAFAWDIAGESDSAIAVYERYLVTSAYGRLGWDSENLPVVLRRLGELHEAAEHADRAIEYYSQFVELWKDADPELQPQVDDVRGRIARLVGENR